MVGARRAKVLEDCDMYRAYARVMLVRGAGRRLDSLAKER